MQTSRASRPVKVYMLDLLAVVPYYTMSLCAALTRQPGVKAVCGSTTYHRDAGFHTDRGLRLDPGVINVSWKLGWAWPAVRRTARLAEYLLNLVLLALRFAVSRPAVLHVQFLPLLGMGVPFEIWLLRYCRSLGIRLSCTIHNILPHDSRKAVRDRWARLYKMTDSFVCHDRQSAARMIEEFGVSADAITVIPHGPMFGTDRTLSQAEAKRKLGLPANCQLVLCQGIVRPYKGVPFLLDVWQNVAKAAPTGRLVVAGHAEPGIREELEMQVERLGIASSVQLDFQFLPASSVELYHQAADILAYPYKAVTTSGALMTGMAAGKAIVASRLPAFEELLRHEESALLVPYGETSEFAAELLRLMGDPGLRRRLSEQSNRIADALLGWDAIAELTAAFHANTASIGHAGHGDPAVLAPKADAHP